MINFYYAYILFASLRVISSYFDIQPTCIYRSDLKFFFNTLGRECVLIFSCILEMLMTLKSIDKYTNTTNFYFQNDLQLYELVLFSSCYRYTDSDWLTVSGARSSTPKSKCLLRWKD